MSNWITRIVVVALTSIALFLPAAALPVKADPIGWKNTLLTARASFSSVDGAGIQTDVNFGAFDGSLHFVEEREPDMRSDSILELSIVQFDSTCPFFEIGCPPRTLHAIAFVRPLPDTDFQVPAISPGVIATLNTTAVVFDLVSETSFEVFIDMTVLCIGPVQHVGEPAVTQSPEQIDVARNSSIVCLAEALGSISDGYTNFTPNPSEDALMREETTVEIEVSPGEP